MSFRDMKIMEASWITTPINERNIDYETPCFLPAIDLRIVPHPCMWTDSFGVDERGGADSADGIQQLVLLVRRHHGGEYEGGG